MQTVAQKKTTNKERKPAQKKKKPEVKKTTTNTKKTIRKKSNTNSTSNVFNVGSYVRKETKLKVSPTFIYEVKGRIEDLLNDIVPEAEQVARAEGMRTLQEHHLIRVFDFRQPSQIRLITCTECKHAFTIANAETKKTLSCPFCHKKRGIVIE